MKKFRVEFNTSGFYYGAGVWECIDEFDDIEAENVPEAIDLAKTWYLENSADIEEAERDVENFAWRGSEITYDEDGYMDAYNWEFD